MSSAPGGRLLRVRCRACGAVFDPPPAPRASTAVVEDAPGETPDERPAAPPAGPSAAGGSDERRGDARRGVAPAVVPAVVPAVACPACGFVGPPGGVMAPSGPPSLEGFRRNFTRARRAGAPDELPDAEPDEAP